MADQSFEADLARMFQDAPTFADQAEFARKVERRLDRGWSFRSLLIGLLGLVGGLVAVGQKAGANLLDRVLSVSQASVNAAQHTATTLPCMIGLVAQAVGLHALPVGAEVIWPALGMLGLAGALLATRSLEEI